MKPTRPTFGKSQLPKPATRQTLAGAVGSLPAPPRLAKPPAPRVAKPAVASPARPTTVKPRAPQAFKLLASTLGKRQSVAGRLGAFVVTRLRSALPPSGGAGRR